MESKTKKTTNLQKGNKELPQLETNPLINRCFHTLRDDGKLEYQGAVMGSPEPGWYLVMFFNWLDGQPSYGKLVRFEDMQDWMFYFDDEHMRWESEYGYASRLKAYANKHDSDKTTDVRNKKPVTSGQAADRG